MNGNSIASRRRCRRSVINSAGGATFAFCWFMRLQFLALGKKIGVRAFTAWTSPLASSLRKRQSVHLPLSTNNILCAKSSSTCSSSKYDLYRAPLSPLGPASKILLKSVQETLLDEILPKLLKPDDINNDENNNTCTQADDLSVQSCPTMVVTVTMVLGVSGGCDSVALLHALNHFVLLQRQQQQQEESKTENSIPNIRWNLHIAHFDHQQRGEDSDRDRDFVQSLCQDLQLPFHCYYWDDRHNQQTTTTKSLSFSQDAARQWRRSCMRKLLWNEMFMSQRQTNANSNDDPQQRNHAGLLLTAHHKDDSEETLLLKLLRGVHLTRISGLPFLQRDESNFATETTPNMSMPTVYWARPLIHLRKTTIHSFLHENQYAWCEDASNQSNKYRRNRVRNELMPLLHDILGGGDKGSALLEQRLAHAQAQSRELRDGLEPRATQYLANHSIAITNDESHSDNPQQKLFLLPSSKYQTTASDPPSMHFELVAKEALHMWLVQQTNGSLFVSYEQLQRLLTQLQDFPRRLQWRLNLGDGWDVQREGETLRMLRIANDRDKQEEHGSSSPEAPAKLLEWCPVSDLELEENDNGFDSATNGTTIILRISGKYAGTDKLRFYQTVVGDSKFKITPSWRPNSKPIKISSFLRGQNVPLHLRKHAAVVTVALSGQEDKSNDDDESRSLVAVFVSSKNEWMVDATFAADAASQDDTDLTNNDDRIALRLIDDN